MAELTGMSPSAGSKTTQRPRTYRIKAIWKTLQGEGLFAGRPAVFVRFVGCNMWTGYKKDRPRDADRTGAECPLWCDTDFTKEGSRPLSADDLVQAMISVGEDVRFCVLTGGEPLLQIDAPLIDALHRGGFQVAMETNGTVALRETCWDENQQAIVAPDWIVCSPKLPEERLVLETFDELKLVVPDYLPQHYVRFAGRRRQHHAGGHPLPLLWLQPEDGPRLKQASEEAIALALAHPSWRVSVQTHKILNID